MFFYFYNTGPFFEIYNIKNRKRLEKLRSISLGGNIIFFS
jgi:hypothetical protein